MKINETLNMQLDNEIKVAYDIYGSKLAQTIRSKTNVDGYDTVFQHISRQEAAESAELGKDIEAKNALRNIPCSLKDYYSAQWLNELSEFSQNTQERLTFANANAISIGSKVDNLIIQELNKSTADTVNLSGPNSLDIDGATEILTKLHQQGADESFKFVVIGWAQWNALSKIDSFFAAPYVNDIPQLSNAKRWMGAIWIAHNSIVLEDNTTTCFAYHKHDIAYAQGKDIATDITWHNDKASYFCNTTLRAGAVAINTDNIIKINISAS